MNKNLPILIFIIAVFFSISAKANVDISSFNEGLAYIWKDGKCGYMDKDGNFPIKRKFRDCSAFHDGLAAVRLDQKHYGYINHSGKFIIKPEYIKANDFSDGIAAVLLSGDSYGSGENAPVYGLINKSGHLFYKLEKGIRIESTFHNGVIAISQNHLYGYLSVEDNKVRIIVPPQLQAVQGNDAFNEGNLAAAELNNKWGFITRSGKWEFSPKFELAGNFHEGLACAQVNGKYGYIDLDGEWVISPQYDTCSDFHNGRAVGVTSGSVRGVIDNRGNWLVRPQFNWMNDYDSSGHAFVIRNDSFGNGPYLIGFIDLTGNIIFEKSFEKWSNPSEGLTLVRDNGLYGFINSNGDWVISPNRLENAIANYFGHK